MPTASRSATNGSWASPRDVVRFRWKHWADAGRVKLLALSADEFIRRFLLHVLPRGFMRIRHFLLFANRRRKQKLARCRQLLGQTPTEEPPAPESARDLILRLTGTDIGLCPVCHQGRLRVVQRLAPLRQDGTP